MAYADGNIVIGTSVDVGGLNTGLAKINKSFKRLQRIAALAIGVNALTKLGKAATEAASDLQEVQNIVDVSFGDMAYKIEAFADTCIEKYGMSELAAKQTAGAFMAMGNAMGLTRKEASDLAVQLTGLTGDFASFYNISQDYAKVALSAVYTGETETLKRYGIVLTEANLQEYAQSIGIEKSVKAMGARDKLILRYKYIMETTQDIQGDFVRTQDSWANGVRVLQERWKQFLITMGDGLITVLTPMVKILNVIVAKLIQMAKIFWVIMSNIFGINLQSFEEQMGGLGSKSEDAAGNMEDLADGVKDATKAAKKAIAPYDELTLITRDLTSSKNDTDGLLDLGDIDLGLDSSDAQQKVDDFFSKINTLFDFGKLIGDSISNGLDNIDWNKIYAKFRNFGKGLAEFLNGLFSTDVFGSVGRTIASALNAAIYAALSFGQEFDWAQLGTKIADGINEFFRTFDFAALAETINVWVQGLFTLIKELLANIDWKDVFQGVKDFFSNLDPETIAILMGFIALKKLISMGLMTAFIEGIKEGLKIPSLVELVGGLGKTLGEKLASPVMWTEIGNGLKSAFTSAIGFVTKTLPHLLSTLFTQLKIDLTGGFSTLFANLQLGNSLNASLTYAFGSIATTIAGIITTIGGAVLAGVNFFKMLKDGFSWLKEALMVIGIAIAAVGAVILGAPAAIAAVVAGIVAAVATLVVVIKEHWEGICYWFAGIPEWFNTNVVEPIGTFFTTVGTTIGNFFSGIWDKVTGIWGKAKEWMDTTVITPISDLFSGVAERIGQFFEGCWIIIKAVWIIVSDWFDKNVATPISNLFTLLGGVISTAFQNCLTFIKYLWAVVSQWFNDNVIVPLQNFFTLLGTVISTAFKNCWNFIKGVWGTVTAWFTSNIINPIKALFTTLGILIRTAFQNCWNGVKAVWSTVANWFRSSVITPITAAFQTFKAVITMIFSNIWSAISNGAKAAFNGIISFVESCINKIIGALNFFIKGFNKIATAASKITGDSYSGVDTFDNIHIPRLAKGAVIPPNNEFLAVLGDQKRGTNIEAPLETIKEAVAEVIAQMENVGGNNQPIVLQLNGKVIAKAVWDEEEKRYKQTKQSGSYKPSYA